jgi:hypothetical protein
VLAAVQTLRLRQWKSAGSRSQRLRTYAAPPIQVRRLSVNPSEPRHTCEQRQGADKVSARPSAAKQEGKSV